MDLADAVLFLQTTLREPLTELELQSNTAALEEIVADAMLATGLISGVDEAGTAAWSGASVYGARLVLDYLALRRIYRGALSRVDVSIGSPSVSKSRSQFATAMKAALDSARADALPYLTAGHGSAWQAGEFVLPVVADADGVYR